ncbi:hypothetical protein OD91_0693 [Lutibacter sp. Hel_I_33_5]|uniref:hypothetical protein n=1 Tax=Lutibacter sp. Hel_I_33_5 TaxID=1566289 RepID=UPI00119E3D91|nr:hypothetical protein [Lutibacter sp. Hel_I_33_5]TVZ55445.1 hypothetical protein OD91_0693 [Lutibacter sp. Hel_I_33_5]
MKKFVINISTLIIPIILILVVVNYIGDSANLFKAGYEFKIAKIIAKKNYVTNLHNYDERLFQKEIIKTMKKAPEIIVLGSSSSMFIDRTLLKNNNIYNNSVSGASLEDYIAIYQIYKEYNKTPKTIIINIAPYQFNKNSTQERWKSIQHFYYNFYNKKEANNEINKYKEFFSLSYFQSSLPKFFKVITGKSEPLATRNKFNITITELTDGSHVYGKSYRDASKIEIEKKVSSLLAGDLPSIERFNSIDESIWAEFEKLISDMKKNNIIIEFFLCPLHPKIYNRIEEDYPMVLKTENLIIKYAKYHNIKLYGSFSPTLIGLDETFFYDGMHCKENGIKKILQSKD